MQVETLQMVSHVRHLLATCGQDEALPTSTGEESAAAGARLRLGPEAQQLALARARALALRTSCGNPRCRRGGRPRQAVQRLLHRAFLQRRVQSRRLAGPQAGVPAVERSKGGGGAAGTRCLLAADESQH